MAKFDDSVKQKCFAFDLYSLEALQAAIDELMDDFIKFCYIVHDHDSNKWHAHVMIDYGANTTLKFIRKIYKHLAANEFIMPVLRPWNYYKYLYHDQSIEKAKGKHVYLETDIKKFNGFDPLDLKNYTENERTVLMDEIMKYANNAKIYEYAGLLEFLSDNDRELYKFAMNNTILVNSYISSHRNRNKKVEESNNNC